MIYRLILPEHAKASGLKHALEGEFTEEEIQSYNAQLYNVYFFPNSTSLYSSKKGVFLSSQDIDEFNFCFIDLDMKDYKSQDPDRSHNYVTKEEAISRLMESKIPPTSIVDSGGGIHAYWSISDLDVKSYLRLQRRLCRFFHTDPEVSKIAQLMRVPNTVNTKRADDFRLCSIVGGSEITYTCEDLDKNLPNILSKDETYCIDHYDNIFNPGAKDTTIDDKIPIKFSTLIRDNSEVRGIWEGNTDDRSKSDFRLGHIMYSNGFTRGEALSVLVNSSKALSRAPKHRFNYANNIVDQIWTFEETPKEQKNSLLMGSSVRDILERHGDDLEGTRFPCYKYLDNTHKGYRLGQVIGLVAGSGVGKTAMALNMFLGFVVSNPEYDHFFFPLEQPDREIADRWKALCGTRTHLYDKVHIISNHGPDGKFRDLSLKTIKQSILDYQKDTGRKVGSCVIDHIGILANDNKLGQDEGVKKLCKEMKAFALETNTMLVMQSQTSREKAGIGDLELNKDAAFGTSVFENFCDFLICLWQPLKRCYSEGAPTIMAYKFCKIRHKKQHLDNIKEDVCYKLYFDPSTESLRELTQDEENAFKFFLTLATNKRKQDRKTDIVQYNSVRWNESEEKK